MVLKWTSFGLMAGATVVTPSAFADWLQSEVDAGRMSRSQMSDLLGQKALLDSELRNNPSLSFSPRGRRLIIGYVANERFEASDIQTLLSIAKREFPGRMLYFEPMGFTLF
jgi:hypothetical protein